MKYLWLVLVLLVSPLNAEIYRWQDESGRIIYSDQPHPGAELITVTQPTSYKAPAVNNIPEEMKEEEEEGPLYNVSVTSPQQDEILWANDGNLPVSVQIDPELDVKVGQRLITTVDGATLGEPQVSTSFTIPLAERGPHSISVSIVNINGQTLATSSPISFQLMRPSVIIRNNNLN